MNIIQTVDALKAVQSGLTPTATPATGQTIMLFAADGTPAARIPVLGLSEAVYGTCSTGATVAEKVVTITDFVLLKGVVVSVFFNYAIDVQSATLNVSGTGAKSIYYRGAAITPRIVRGGCIVTMMYDGTRYNVIAIDGFERSDSDSSLYVDLGLPSGLKWARYNIDVSKDKGFAVNAEDSGSYFSWGHPNGYNPNTSVPDNEAFVGINEFSSTAYAALPAASIAASLAPSADMARVAVRAPWRLPTATEWQELYTSCSWTWTTQNGVNGYLVSSNSNANTIFLPAAGYGENTSLDNNGTTGCYWSSVYDSASAAASVSFSSSSVNVQTTEYRYLGLSVRPVQ